MTKTNFKLEMHILQSFPPSNLNRDDSGMPKDCEFGGYRRARISSQCLKRSIRYSEGFKTTINNEIGMRTKRAGSELTELLIKQYEFNEETAKNSSESVLSFILGGFDKDESKVLFYTDKSEISALAEEISKFKEELEKFEVSDEGKKGKKAKDKENPITATAKSIAEGFVKSRQNKIDSVDIALFGRMLADEPRLKIDAACQVAHAISTNRVNMDFDYFTALDDLKPHEEQGAGMIGSLAFNSACFYRYAVLDLNLLMKNLGNNAELAQKGTIGFVKGMIEAIPTGKQNTFAAHTPPALIVCVIKENSMPISLANAFEKPVTPKGDKSLTEASISEFVNYWDKIVAGYNPNHKSVVVYSMADDKLFEPAKNKNEDNKPKKESTNSETENSEKENKVNEDNNLINKKVNSINELTGKIESALTGIFSDNGE